MKVQEWNIQEQITAAPLTTFNSFFFYGLPKLFLNAFISHFEFMQV